MQLPSVEDLQNFMTTIDNKVALPNRTYNVGVERTSYGNRTDATRYEWLRDMFFYKDANRAFCYGIFGLNTEAKFNMSSSIFADSSLSVGVTSQLNSQWYARFILRYVDDPRCTSIYA